MVWVHIMYLQASIRGALARCEEENALGYFGLKVEKNSTAPTHVAVPLWAYVKSLHTLVATDCQLISFFSPHMEIIQVMTGFWRGRLAEPATKYIFLQT